jgi:hypothetical protein
MKHFILITVIAGICLLGLYSLTDTDYTSGPWPKELRPGFRIVTDGKWFALEYRPYYSEHWHSLPSLYDSACEACESTWRMQELDRRERHAPKEPERDWSVVAVPKSGDWCEVKK